MQCSVSLSYGVLSHATLLQDAELSPAGARGTVLVLCIDLAYDVGSLLGAGVAFAVNTVSAQGSEMSWLWRLVLGGSVLQAFALVCIVPFIPETPASLVQRGRLDAGLHALRELRGPFVTESTLSDEFGQLLLAAGGGDEVRGASSVSFCFFVLFVCLFVLPVSQHPSHAWPPHTHAHTPQTQHSPKKGRLLLRELRNALRAEQAPLLILIVLLSLLSVNSVCVCVCVFCRCC